MGKLAVLQEKVAASEEATWQAVKDANDLLAEMQADNGVAALWYPRLCGGQEAPPSSGWCDKYAIYLISDSAFKNMKSRHSQGAYALLLVEVVKGKVGGKAHVLEFASRKSRRVAKSTWAAELHAFINGLERLERLHDWLKEIYQGPSGLRGMARLESAPEPFMERYGLIDCKGLSDSLTQPAVGSLLDVSMLVYLQAAREAFADEPLSAD